jgi:hypothetical protein
LSQITVSRKENCLMKYETYRTPKIDTPCYRMARWPARLRRITSGGACAEEAGTVIGTITHSGIIMSIQFYRRATPAHKLLSSPGILIVVDRGWGGGNTSYRRPSRKFIHCLTIRLAYLVYSKNGCQVPFLTVGIQDNRLLHRIRDICRHVLERARTGKTRELQRRPGLAQAGRDDRRHVDRTKDRDETLADLGGDLR